MSRRHSSTFNLTGTKRRATPSPTRSPARLPSTRIALRPPRPVAPPLVLAVLDPGEEIGPIDIHDQFVFHLVIDKTSISFRPDIVPPRRSETYEEEISQFNHLVGGITTIGEERGGMGRSHSPDSHCHCRIDSNNNHSQMNE